MHNNVKYGSNDSSYDDTDAVFYEESMKVFCTDNMTNNIQYGVTSHYPSTSGGATAQSLEGIVIGMGFTIGYPIFHNGGSSLRVDQEFCKRGGARGSGELWFSANSR